MKPKKIVFFFDGFNFYHSLKEKKEYWDFLWLDYQRLAELFTPKTNILSEVVWFTAYATWKPQSERRHKDYARALMTRGVTIILGKFKTRDKFCKLCHRKFIGHEEKQTDVNIAVNLLVWAREDRFDEIVLCTADSDLLPAIKALKKDYPHKTLTLLFPINRRSYELESFADKIMHVKEMHLRASQFPDEIKLPDGSIIHRPSNWHTPVIDFFFYFLLAFAPSP